MQQRLHYGWVVVAVGALASCVGFGAMFSLAVFLQPMGADTGWTRGGIAAGMTLNFLAMGLCAFGWGALSDRIGARKVLAAGGLLLALGLVWASRSRSLLEFQLVYGLIVGAAGGSFMAPMIATVSHWFTKHRAIAISLVSAGLGVAPMTVSPFAAWLISQLGWRDAQAVIGLGAAALLVPAAMLVKLPPQMQAVASGAAPAGLGAETAKALRSMPFAILALTFLLCCATHSGPIFHTVSYAIGCGLPTMAAVMIYSVEGLAGLGGRVVLGVAADRFGAKQVLIVGLLVQALAAGTYALVARAGEFYAVAVVFGMAYGGTMPLYAVLARSSFPPQIMGSVLGALTLCSSLGMALGPAVGGWLYDRYGTYVWLYAGSLAVGLAAVAVAFFVQPAPRARALRQAVPA